MNRVWQEVIYAAKQAPRMFFAPFVGAVRETRKVLQEIVSANQARAAQQHHKQPTRPQ